MITKYHKVLIQKKSGSITKYINDGRKCEQKECINTASYIMTNINDTVDPCTDFYEYACGSWLDLNKMPANQYSYSVVTKIADQNDQILFELMVWPHRVPKLLFLFSLSNVTHTHFKPLTKALTRPEKRLDDDKYGRQKARDFFLSCQNVPILNDRGTTPLLADIASVGGWQALDNWDRGSWDIDNMLYKLIGVYSQGALISVSVKMDPRYCTRLL